MVKKPFIIFTIVAMTAFAACTCWGYTVNQWPAPGVPNTVYGPATGLPGNSGYGGYSGYGGNYGYGYPGYYGGYPGGYGAGYYGQGRGR